VGEVVRFDEALWQKICPAIVLALSLHAAGCNCGDPAPRKAEARAHFVGKWISQEGVHCLEIESDGVASSGCFGGPMAVVEWPRDEDESFRLVHRTQFLPCTPQNNTVDYEVSRAPTAIQDHTCFVVEGDPASERTAGMFCRAAPLAEDQLELSGAWAGEKTKLGISPRGWGEVSRGQEITSGVVSLEGETMTLGFGDRRDETFELKRGTDKDTIVLDGERLTRSKARWSPPWRSNKQAFARRKKARQRERLDAGSQGREEGEADAMGFERD